MVNHFPRLEIKHALQMKQELKVGAKEIETLGANILRSLEDAQVPFAMGYTKPGSVPGPTQS